MLSKHSSTECPAASLVSGLCWFGSAVCVETLQIPAMILEQSLDCTVIQMTVHPGAIVLQASLRCAGMGTGGQWLLGPSKQPTKRRESAGTLASYQKVLCCLYDAYILVLM